MRELPSAKKTLIPIGMIGAGRTRGGLGPFLSKFLEEEGFLVAGVSGRSLERATVNARSIGRQLGHEIPSFGSPGELCAKGLAALAIASPSEFHLEALQAAAAAGLPTFCEKPLVHEKHGHEGAELVEIFRRQRIPLVENCQWPNVLPAFFQLHGPVENGRHLKVELGLGTARHGRDMVQNTASHLLSVIQAIAPMDQSVDVTDVRVSDASYKEKNNLLQFRLVAPEKIVEAVLHLEIHRPVPRPAWLAINGRRIDRHVGEGYSISFSANGRQVAIDDPTRELVKHFARLVRSRQPALIDHHHCVIRQRLRWYRQVLHTLK